VGARRRAAAVVTAPVAPDDVADPAGYVLAVADLAEAQHGTDHPRHEMWVALAALWRLIATEHRAEAGMFPPVCPACAPTIEYDEETDDETELLPLVPCGLLIAVVAAARAYLTGAGG
jgi:hypothetical protein